MGVVVQLLVAPQASVVVMNGAVGVPGVTPYETRSAPHLMVLYVRADLDVVNRPSSICTAFDYSAEEESY